MAGIDAQLAALPDMPAAALRARWDTLVGPPCPRLSPALLRLALAWELQASAYGGLSRVTQALLQQEATGKTRTSQPRPGMRLVRSWNGVVQVVSVDEHGLVHWNGRSWNSLSEVARAITGTRWSGPAFFGLRKKVA